MDEVSGVLFAVRRNADDISINGYITKEGLAMNIRRTMCILLTGALVPVGFFGCSGNGASEGEGVVENAPQQSNASAQAEDAGNPQSADSDGTGNSESPASEEGKEGPRKLFIIERSKNANIVRYDAQLTDEGKLDSDEPVVAYWILLADEGQRAELSYLQRKMAYGFETKPASSGEGYIMMMKPLPKRELRIKKVDEEVRAIVEVDGKPAVLEKIYVESEAGWTGPNVQYVKLFGKDLETGEKRTEKIQPD